MTKGEKKEHWLIGVGGNEMDGVSIYRVCGTKEDVKRYIAERVTQDKDQCEDDAWEYGSEDADSIEERFDGSLYGYSCFTDFHLDYEAKREDDIELLML